MKGWRDATHTTKLLVDNNVGFSQRSALSRVLQVCRNSPSTVTSQRGIFCLTTRKTATVVSRFTYAALSGISQ